jgi:HD-GYP domain-containing protein (c-di-GMP phosphodiesterase class II)
VPGADETSWSLTATNFDSPARPGRADPWLVLEQFGGKLLACASAAERNQLLLETVCAGLDSDAAYLWSAAADDPPVPVGRRSLPAEWCRDLARGMLDQSPGTESQLLRSSLRGVRTPAGDVPSSVAMIRLSRSRATWAVALAFHPGRRFTPADMSFLALTRRTLLVQRHHEKLYQRLKDTVYGLIRGFTTAIDAKDRYTRGHSERVARVAVRLGQEMRLPGELLGDLHMAGLLHDIGKIGVRHDVLQKPAKLTRAEEEHLREHPVLGDQIIAGMKALGHLRLAIRHHHECYDGSGYPDRLAGEHIPLLARVLAAADAFDAMLSDRPYRPALSVIEVDAILADGAGRQWDPQVIRSLMSCRKVLYAVREEALQW